jgi:hypothetical protein
MDRVDHHSEHVYEVLLEQGARKHEAADWMDLP